MRIIHRVWDFFFRNTADRYVAIIQPTSLSVGHDISHTSGIVTIIYVIGRVSLFVVLVVLCWFHLFFCVLDVFLCCVHWLCIVCCSLLLCCSLCFVFGSAVCLGAYNVLFVPVQCVVGFCRSSVVSLRCLL